MVLVYGIFEDKFCIQGIEKNSAALAKAFGRVHL